MTEIAIYSDQLEQLICLGWMLGFLLGGTFLLVLGILWQLTKGE